MSDQIINLIIKSLIIIPGISGFAPIDLSIKSEKLNIKSSFKGIKCEKVANKLFNISIAIIINRNTNVATLSREITTTIRKSLTSEKSKSKSKEIKIYVRGVE